MWDHLNEDYEFWVWSLVHASFIIILTCACKVHCDMRPKRFHGKCIQLRMKVPFNREIANQSTSIGACCSTDGHFTFNKTC